MTALGLGVNPDAFTRRIRRGEKLADGIEDDFELIVTVIFQSADRGTVFSILASRQARTCVTTNSCRRRIKASGKLYL